MSRIDVAILGAGNGGCAAAADLTLRGFNVTLCNRSRERLEPLVRRGGVEFQGGLGEGFVPVERITIDVAEAIHGADLILITVPATGHRFYAERIASSVKPDQLIVLNPGSTGGALHVASVLAEHQAPPVTVAELNTLTYVCRMASPSRVNITAAAQHLMLAALPAKQLSLTLERFRRFYPAAEPVDHVLVTSLTNLNAVLHPPGMILNAGWIEHTRGDFYYYYEGTTPAVARVIDKVDEERRRITEAFGFKTPAFLDFFYRVGYTSRRAWQAGSIYEALKDSTPNRYIKSPPHLEGRYIEEDIGFGLVPMRALARLAGVSVPTMEALIRLASLANDTDYFEVGLNAEKLGVAGMSRDELNRYLQEGRAGS
ncbi:MAG: NAD/NADP octopine/nopaline dehydrogenase family protein [Candidatus Bipolaricaulia bacterium]